MASLIINEKLEALRRCVSHDAGGLARVWIPQTNAYNPELEVARKEAAEMGYQDRITIEPGKRDGQPSIRGMRITVYDVLGWLAAGQSWDEICEDYPELSLDDIRAVLEYAAMREHHTWTIRAA